MTNKEMATRIEQLERDLLLLKSELGFEHCRKTVSPPANLVKISLDDYRWMWEEPHEPR